jgi:hypothetical protein
MSGSAELARRLGAALDLCHCRLSALAVVSEPFPDPSLVMRGCAYPASRMLPASLSTASPPSNPRADDVRAATVRAVLSHSASSVSGMRPRPHPAGTVVASAPVVGEGWNCLYTAGVALPGCQGVVGQPVGQEA